MTAQLGAINVIWPLQSQIQAGDIQVQHLCMAVHAALLPLSPEPCSCSQAREQCGQAGLGTESSSEEQEANLTGGN